MKKLRELYEAHKGKVSDKWDIYLDEYDRFFMPYRNEEINLLEIGVQNGGSLEIWSKYFPKAKSLIGCDINEDCKKLHYEDPRINVIVDDANTDIAENQILAISDNFDIIIDDGSHTSGDIIRTFCRYFNYLNDDGVFIAEDLHCSYWQEYEGGIYHPYSSIAFFKSLADITNHEHWGIDKSQHDYLNLFSKHYDFDLNHVDFSKVHSIEFVNSICIIRKKPFSNNVLGERFIAGFDAQVVSDLQTIKKHHATPDQKSNKFSIFIRHPAEEVLELRVHNEELSSQNEELSSQNEELSSQNEELKSQKDAFEKTISDILSSTSWKLTLPLRKAKSILKSVSHLRTILSTTIRIGGGYKSTLRKAINLYRQEGFSGLKRGIDHVQTRSVNGYPERNDYAKWIALYDYLNDEKRQIIRDRVEAFTTKPLISIVMPVYNANTKWLTEAIESVRSQLYTNWELCIADDKSTDPAVKKLLNKYAKQDKRIKLIFRKENGHISAASNSALTLASGEWIALMDQDDLLAEHALFWVADAIHNHIDAKLIYSDEDKINEKGIRQNPYFKCDWNRDLFYSQNMISHLGVYNHEIVKDIGGFRVGFEGSQDHDLALRFIERIKDDQIHHIPRILYHWRVHADSTAGGSDAKPYAVIAGERALSEHFERIGISANVRYCNKGYRVRYRLPKIHPLVSLIIPTRNGLSLIQTCIESIVDKTTYDNYEIIIIDNGSDDNDCLDYLSKLEATYSKVKVIHDDRPFNYSALNNHAVLNHASGDVIGLINNDIEVIEPDWLTEMVSLAIQPDIGAVGAKLLYADNRIQHAGVVIGIGGVAGHAHKYFDDIDVGYFSRAVINSAYSAVTAACLLVEKSKYIKVGGLNEQDLAVAFNDVDFCLKLKQYGLRNVFTPYAKLYHHESVSRGQEDTPEKQNRFKQEIDYMVQHWGNYIANDPSYSPNLTLTHEDFSLAWPPRNEIL